jgi:tetratricopeptide (TPR) repeat protein
MSAAAWPFYMELAMNSVEQGNLAEAEELCYSAVREAEAIDAHGRRLATSLEALASLASHRGRYLRAQHLYHRAWCILKATCGPKAPETAAALVKIGCACVQQDKHAEAEPLFAEALAAFDDTRPRETATLVKCLQGLGDVHLAANRRVAAVVAYQRALALQENGGGTYALPMMSTLHRLADLYLRDERYQDAEPYLWRAHKIAGDTMGAESAAVAVALRKLAEMYRLQKRLEQAENLLVRALPMIENALGPRDAEVARHFRQMSLVYRDRARYQDAAGLLAQGVEILEKALDSDHPEVAELLELRAGALDVCHRAEAARALRERAAEIRRKLATED